MRGFLCFIFGTVTNFNRVLPWSEGQSFNSSKSGLNIMLRLLTFQAHLVASAASPYNPRASAMYFWDIRVFVSYTISDEFKFAFEHTVYLDIRSSCTLRCDFCTRVPFSRVVPALRKQQDKYELCPQEQQEESRVSAFLISKVYIALRGGVRLQVDFWHWSQDGMLLGWGPSLRPSL